MFVAPICLTIKNDIVEEVKNLVMAFQMPPCCCFYESSLRRLLRRFSLIFHPEGHTSDDSTAANKHIKPPMKYWLFLCLFGCFRTIPSWCSTTTVTRRWCPCGCVAVWRRGVPRDTPDGDHGDAWRGARRLQGELHLYALLPTRAQKSLDVENFMWVTLP